MAELKTKETDSSVEAFVESIENEQQRQETKELIQLFKEATGFEAKMWGTSIIGFGRYHYKYPSGHEGDSALASFAPRKGKFSLYLWLDEERKAVLLNDFGKYTKGKGCVYVKQLSDVHLDTLRSLIKESVAHLQKEHDA
ncbi:DUF1801 domain-containing protein [Desemzia sp. RIT804]|uniref:DUF1801 domain-containing protein n=1 Tax=Desemzia sp. RIT 804 TaxID=2810209 RepID=UPI00195164AE|nr:DUF1801 domain-containing protein [Desemzia sp. RIT 804]MBM6614333.1 DUF1801 domain-containing protein [Desemzia sp. RIT 804]